MSVEKLLTTSFPYRATFLARRRARGRVCVRHRAGCLPHRRCRWRRGRRRVRHDGSGAAAQGYSAADVELTHKGVGYLLAEGALPVRCRAFHLDDSQLTHLAQRAQALRAGTAGRS